MDVSRKDFRSREDFETAQQMNLPTQSQLNATRIAMNHFKRKLTLVRIDVQPICLKISFRPKNFSKTELIFFSSLSLQSPGAEDWEKAFTFCINQTSKYEDVTTSVFRRMLAWELLKRPAHNYRRFSTFIGEEENDFEKYVMELITNGYGDAGKFCWEGKN